VQKSNLYVIFFTAIVTIVFGGLLALAAVGFGPLQKKNRELDAKKKILGAVMELQDTDDVISIYKKRIKSLVVDIDGNEKGEDIIAEEVNIGKEFKKPPEERLLPVFKYYSENDPEKVEAYIINLYGNGLWDKIWAYLALENDLNTIKGIVFDHKAETPGLGARITDKEVQQRFAGKKLYDDLSSSFNKIGMKRKLISVKVLRGEGHKIPEDNYHEVDGLSGATMTTKGMNKMMMKYLGYYENYFDKVLEMQKEQERAQIDKTDSVSTDMLQLMNDTIRS